MVKLLKTILFTTRKDKLLIAAIIIAAAFMLIETAGAVIINNVLLETAEGDPDTLEAIKSLGLGVTGRGIFGSMIGSGSTLVLILNLFIIILMCKEFRDGAVRSKILCGNSIPSVYFAFFIFSLIFTLPFVLVYAFALLGLVSAFCGYGTAFTASEFGTLMLYTLYGMLTNLFSISLCVFIAMNCRTVGKSILFYFLVMIVLGIVSGIIQSILSFGGNDVIRFINNLNPQVFAGYVSSYGVTLENGLQGISSIVILSAALTVGGAFLCKRLDVK